MEYVPWLGKWYLHLYDVMQADLNWENPAVREEMADILRFWKAKGIKGFRFDVINVISSRRSMRTILRATAAASTPMAATSTST